MSQASGGRQLRLILSLSLITVSLALLNSLAQAQSKSFPVDLSQLMRELGTDEKSTLLSADSGPIYRFKIPSYHWWNEGLHSVMHKSARVTVFPQPIGLAATFDEDLLKRVGTAIGSESRALFEESRRRGEALNEFMGVTLWSPNLNLLRDARWGRGSETYGEDPQLISRLGVAMVRGLQGDDPYYFLTVATPKHFVAHNGPERNRFSFDAQITDQDLWDSEMPGFRAAITEGKAFSLMTAYNAINGIPASAHSVLLNDVVKNDWRFPGVVVTDCGAIGGIYWAHRFTDGDKKEARGVARALEAGVDLECGGEFRKYMTEATATNWSISSWQVTQTRVNDALRRVMTAQARLGLLGDPADNPFAKIPLSVVGSAAYESLALESARKSIVLLKNQNNVLPLDPAKLRKVVVIGPNADSALVMNGTYAGQPTRVITALQGLRSALPNTEIKYYRGSAMTEEADGVVRSPYCSQLRRYDAKGRVVEAERSEFRGAYALAPAATFRVSDKPNAARGLEGLYYANSELKGDAAALRVDQVLGFDWGDRGPDALPPDYSREVGDHFSVRWRGFLRVPVSGVQRFALIYDDSAYLKLNGKAVVEDWKPGGSRVSCFSVEGKEGELIAVDLGYSEVAGRAKLQLLTEQPDQMAAIGQDARDADAVIAIMGADSRLEGENHDKDDIRLPDTQESFLRELRWSLPTKTPFVMALFNGNPLSLRASLDVPHAIVEAWYAGQMGGQALAEVLLGKVNPSGRLPVSVLAPFEWVPFVGDYSMKGRTYRYLEQKPQFAFGFGLSYTTFAYANFKAAGDNSPPLENLKVRVDVSNTGSRDGDEVVQLYANYNEMGDADFRRPRIPNAKLVSFQRVHLAAGETRAVEFEVTPRQLALVDYMGRTYSPAGKLKFWVGGSQPPGPTNPVPQPVGLWLAHERKGFDYILPR